jgi:hypothetical protein
LTSTVFLSGSRRVSRLPAALEPRLEKIVERGLYVVVGDANGVDKAFQGWLNMSAYRNVTVYCSGGECRNNVGAWPTEMVAVPEGVKGREFYTQKDLAMARTADYGLVAWDGKSAGSITNALELIKRSKPVIVYLTSDKSFHSLKGALDFETLFARCAPEDVAELRKKIPLQKLMREATAAAQAEFLL